MLRRHARHALWALVGVPVLLAACSSDNNMTSSNPAEIVGNWNATSFVAGGVDGIALGMTVAFSFTSNTYSFTVTNDQFGLCNGTSSCSDGGSYSATGTNLTLDPGTVDSVTLNYSISGSVLSVTGTIDGTPISITFQKV